jgi:hypothetical protein
MFKLDLYEYDWTKKNNVLRLKDFILGGIKILMKGQVLKTVIKGLTPPY